MTTSQNEMVLRSLNALRLTRRQLVGSAAATAVALPTASWVASRNASATPRAAIRAQTDPRTLIGLDNLPGQNWLYYDPAKLYEINPASGFQVVYECLYHIPD
jgi:hypothetical protein